jgi:hypothetical protein
MPDSLLDKIEYDENAPDVRDIMRQVQEHVARQRGDTPRAGGHTSAPTGGMARIYEELAAAESDLYSGRVVMSVVPSHIPIAGWLLTRIRRSFHQLVVYYVDRLAQAQARFNTHLIAAVRVLSGVVEHQGQLEQVVRLEARVRELEARLAVLETPVAGPAPDNSTQG